MEKFNKDLNDLLKKIKGSNTSVFIKLKYNNLISRIIQLKNNQKKLKKEPNGYKIFKKYDVLKVGDVNKLIVPVSHD